MIPPETYQMLYLDRGYRFAQPTATIRIIPYGDGRVRGVRVDVVCCVCGEWRVYGVPVFVGKGRVVFVGCWVRICVVSGGISPEGIVSRVAVG